MLECKKIVFKTNISLALKENNLNSIDDVPIMNKTAVKELFGDDKAYEFINIVRLGEDYPAKPDSYTTFILTEEWAESFVKSLKASPKPLFIPGHADYAISSKERAVPDGYIVGGLVKNSTLYLRNALPEGKSEYKKELIEQTIREIKAKMLATSTSDFMKYKQEIDADGNLTYFAVESVKGQSNALVEADQTGSSAEIILTSFKAEEGQENHVKGEKSMENKPNSEMFVALKNQIDSGRLALAEVATSLGIDVMTSNQKQALKRLNDAESKVGNITDFVTKISAEKEANFVALKDAKIKDKFKEEELIEIATSFFALKEGDAAAIDTELSRIAELKVVKTIQGKVAAKGNSAPGSNIDLGASEIESTMEG